MLNWPSIPKKYYLAIVFVVATLLYVNTIPNAYNIDDSLVTQNHKKTSKGIKGIPDILTSYYYEDHMGYKYDYRPITHISFALEHQIFGENPHISHFINVLLNAILCSVLFLFLSNLPIQNNKEIAFLTTILFAVHPIHTEVVASIKNRDELLSFLFGGIALLLTLNNEKSKTFKSSFSYWLLAFFFFILGVWSKPSISMFSVLIPFTSIFFYPNRGTLLPFLFMIFSLLFLFFTLNISFWLMMLAIMLSSIFLFIVKWLVFIDKSSFYNIIKNQKNQRVLFFIIVFVLLLLSFFGYPSKVLLVIAAFILSLPFFFNNKLLLKRASFLLFFLLFLFASLFYSSMMFAVYAGFLVLVVLKNNQIKNNIAILLLFLCIACVYWIEKDVKTIYFIIAFAYLYFARRKSIFWWIFFVLVFATAQTIFSTQNLIKVYIASVLLLSPIFLRFSLLKRVKLNYILPVLIFSLFTSQLYSDNVSNKKIDVFDSEFIYKQESKQHRSLTYIENPLATTSKFSDKFDLAVTSYLFYLKKLLFPYPLLFYYGYNQVDIVKFPHSIILFLAIAFVVLIVIYYAFKKKKYAIIYALVFLLANILPYSNLLAAVAGIVAERLVFVSSFGFSLLLAILFFDLFYKWKKLASFILGIAFLVQAYSVTHRNSLWKNKSTLYAHDAKNANKSAQANALYAYSFLEKASLNKNEIDSAQIYLSKAIKIYPTYLNWHFDLAKVYEKQNKLQLARKEFQTCISLDSTYIDAYEECIKIDKKLGNFSEIISNANKYLQYNPVNEDVLLELSNAFFQLKMYKKAIHINNKIIAIEPNKEAAYLNKAYSYFYLNQLDSAKLYLKKGESINPRNIGIFNLEKLIYK